MTTERLNTVRAAWIDDARRTVDHPEFGKTAERLIDLLAPLVPRHTIMVGDGEDSAMFDVSAYYLGDAWSLRITVNDEGVRYERTHVEPGEHSPTWAYYDLTPQQAVNLMTCDIEAARDE